MSAISESSSSRHRPRRAAGLAVVAVALVVAGVLLWRRAGAATSVGLYAYSPLPGSVPTPSVFHRLQSWTPTQAVAGGLVVLGLLLGAVVIARLLGTRPAVRTQGWGAVAILGALLIVGGLVAVSALGVPAESYAVVGIRKYTGETTPATFALWGWTRGQLIGAGIVVLGLLLVTGASTFRVAAQAAR